MQILADAPEYTGLFLGVSGVAIAIVACVGTYYVVKVIADGVRRSQATKLEAQARDNQDRLESLMIQRGMSADEIERVLKAEGSRPDFGAVVEDAEACIVEVLSENGYSGADIERILRAARAEAGQISPPAGQLVRTLAENWAKAADIERILQTRREPAPA